MKTCVRCGKPIAPEAAVCPFCGETQKTELLNALPSGTIVAGRYQIEAVAGIGGFGITYRAFDRTLSRVVAVKEYFPTGIANRVPDTTQVILYAGKRAEEFQLGYTRFLDEARRMMQFQSAPNIVQVLGFLEANGTAYIVMEYLQGHTLKDELRQAPLSWQRAVSIGTDICRALTQLHRKGVLHRDISPDNIFLCDDGTVKLIDFGAARVSMREDARLTVVFKDCFTPPEQYSRAARQGAQTDIYALGATLYTAMTGRKPDSARDRAPIDRLRPPHRLVSEIPEAVSNAVMQALAIEPELRFSDAEAFSAALNQYQTAVDLQALRQKKRRKKRLSILIVCLALAIAGSVVGALWLHRTQETTLPDAEISLMFPADTQSRSRQNRLTALQAAADAFCAQYPNVTIRLEPVSPENYEKTLAEAQREKSAPTLFAATGETGFANEQAIKKLRKEVSDTAFQMEPFTERTVALGIGLPVLYAANTASETDVTLLTLGTMDVPVGMKAQARQLYEAVFGSSALAGAMIDCSEDALSRWLNGSSALYLGDTEELSDVQSSMAGRYRLYPLRLGQALGMRQNVWAVSDSAAGRELRCAVRFLAFCLREEGQKILYLENSFPCVPVCGAVYDSYRQVAGELAEVMPAQALTDCATLQEE